MPTRREMTLTLAALAAGIPVLRASSVLADPGAPDGRPGEFSSNELVANGHRFFGSASRGLAGVVEEATKRWGKPNGYVLGQEASGAFIGGLRYGEGVMHTRN
ncbi:MAG: EipA family protein, partial [Methylocella sp.]